MRSSCARIGVLLLSVLAALATLCPSSIARAGCPHGCPQPPAPVGEEGDPISIVATSSTEACSGLRVANPVGIETAAEWAAYLGLTVDATDRDVLRHFYYEQLDCDCHWRSTTSDIFDEDAGLYVEWAFDGDPVDLTTADTYTITVIGKNHPQGDAADRWYVDSPSAPVTFTVTVAVQSEFERYVYDALGRRVARIRPGCGGTEEITQYYYDGKNVVLETDGDETAQRYFVNGSRYIDERVVMHDQAGDTDYYYIEREQHTVVGLVTADKLLVEKYAYDAYGAVRSISHPYAPGAPADQSAYGNPYNFTGRRLDYIADSTAAAPRQLYYYRARTYDPIHARFNQRDPALYVDGMNLYEYAKSNPLAYTDPTGQFSFGSVMSAVGVGARLYGMYGTYTSLAGMVEDFRNGVSLRNILLDFAISFAVDRAGGRVLDALVDFAGPLLKKQAMKLGKGWRKGGEDIAELRANAAAKPKQEHHVVPKGGKKFGAKYEEILNEYDLSVLDEWNRRIMPHQGRHPDGYNAWMLECLERADEFAQGDQGLFLGFMQPILDHVQQNPEILMKEWWQ